MTLVSYAQNQEDVLLSRLFSPNYTGFYVDLGANHPVMNNVTKHFYDKGWHGINVEPLTHLYRLLVEQRPRDLNLHIGISNQSASLTFYRVMDNSASPMDELSHFNSEIARHQRRMGLNVLEETIPVLTLREVCERHVKQPIDFLKIDVEGFERQVIEGADFTRFRPRCIVIEDGMWKGTRARFDWQPLLVAAGFKMAIHDGVNCYFVDAHDKESLEKLEYPVNTTDDFIPFKYTHLAPAQPDPTELIEARALIAEVGPNGAKKVRNAARWLRSHPFLFGIARKVMGIK